MLDSSESESELHIRQSERLRASNLQAELNAAKQAGRKRKVINQAAGDNTKGKRSNLQSNKTNRKRKAS